MSYTLNGIQYPSVTTIIGQLDKSGALIPWALNCYEAKLVELIKEGVPVTQAIETAKKEYKEVSGKALDIGTQVHDAIEQYIKTGKDLSGELLPEVANGFLAFLEWEKENVSKWLESEVRTVQIFACYAGTYDAIFEDKQGKKVMVDFKTSKSIYSEFWLQLAAYKGARESLSGEYTIVFDRGEGMECAFDLPSININYCAILRLDKETGMPEYKTREPVKTIRDYNAFLSLVDFYYKHKKRRLKNNPAVINAWW